MTATSDEEPTKSVLEHLRAWGTNPVPATGAAALIVALHSATSVRHDRTDYAPQKMLSARAAGVVRALPIYIITPMLLGSSYLNVTGNKTDAAGISAAASMTYASLAMKRRQSLSNKFTARGLVRGSAIGLCLANFLAGSYVFGTGLVFGEEE